MRIGFLITARLKSSRLRLKLLMDLGGYNAIERVIQRAKKAHECDDIILCTSTSNQDLPLVRIAQQQGVYYFNGDPHDVLKRLLDAAKLFNLDYVIGITGDNPLFSIFHANLLSDMVRQEPAIDFAYTTGMPIGVNLHILKTKALETICRVKEEVDTEIWGYLINRPEISTVREVAVDPIFRYEKLARLTLDEMDDYRLFQSLYDCFAKESVPDILQIYPLLDAHPAWLTLNAHIVQRDLDDATKQRIAAFFTTHHARIAALKEAIYQAP